jgi:aminocarboxymuconate-semialdehyde decarboxylase
MPIIDFHNHYYPPRYLKALQSGESAVKVTIDDHGNPLLHYPGDYNIAVPGQCNLDIREKMLNDHGIDMQVLSLTTPGTHVEVPATAVRLAAMVNDEFAEGIQAKPKRFTALATLPLNDPDASVKELERACRQLRLPGAMLFSNVNGVPLADPRFFPLYEAANDLGTVLYIHPTHPADVQAMTEFWLMPLVGFLFDTTLAAAHLVFKGVPERFPKIKWALGHLGGAIPYLAERLDRGHRAFRECRVNIQRPPSEYLKHFYFDTVNFDPKAIELAIAFAGVSQILAGSDYAHQIGSPRLMLESIRSLKISEVDKAAILGGNAARLLRLV